MLPLNSLPLSFSTEVTFLMFYNYCFYNITPEITFQKLSNWLHIHLVISLSCFYNPL